MRPVELDEDLLSNNMKQKWKSSASKQMCREAYKFVSSMALPELLLISFFIGGHCQTWIWKKVVISTSI